VRNQPESTQVPVKSYNSATTKRTKERLIFQFEETSVFVDR